MLGFKADSVAGTTGGGGSAGMTGGGGRSSFGSDLLGWPVSTCPAKRRRKPSPVSAVMDRSYQPSLVAKSQVSSVNLDASQNQGAANQLAKVVYFDFDSYVVRDEYGPLMSSYAKLLSGSPQRRLTIEGHTDERGSREYNLALGQKRAEAVRKSLSLLGVKDTQMEAVSFGEERPAVSGSGEEAWAKNRRAELNLR